jgi:cytochrome c oxidase assembly protein subunit 15
VIVELAQGLIGFVQYFTHLPVILVGFHMLGAALVWTGTLAVLWSLRERPAPAPAAPADVARSAAEVEPAPAQPLHATP